MRWGYSSLSLLMWCGLLLYAVITVTLFVLISKNKNKRLSFSVCASLLTGVHAILLLTLGFSSTSASSRSVGFEAWVCGRQVDINVVAGAGRITKAGGGAYFGADNRLVINGEDNTFSLYNALESAGAKIELPKSGLGIPITRDFELKATATDSLAWLSDSIEYPEAADQPVLIAREDSLMCPYSAKNSWNIFVARVNNDKKTYYWQKVAFSELTALQVNSTDGGALPDCVVVDYGVSKLRSEYRCAYLLKRDFERCPELDKSKCDFKELSGPQTEGLN
jgi:hypothetical protein